MTKVQEALPTWLEGAQHIINTYWQRMGYTHSDPPTLAIKESARYAKVINMERGVASSVFAFIDMQNGDVLKPAGWKAPAKHARGNILDEHGGLKYVNWHGPEYMR